MAKPKIKIEYWPVERLRKYAKNAKLHPPTQVDAIGASIGEFGMIQPLLVDTTKGKDELICGHGRLDALLKRGDTEVPVIPVSHLTPAQVKAYRVLDNEIAARGSWSPELLQAELCRAGRGELPAGRRRFRRAVDQGKSQHSERRRRARGRGTARASEKSLRAAGRSLATWRKSPAVLRRLDRP